MRNTFFWNIKNPVRSSQETHYVPATEHSRSMLCKIWAFAAVIMKNTILWDVTPCGSWKKRGFWETDINWLLLILLLVRWFFPPWWERRCFVPKRRFLQEPHGIRFQHAAIFITLYVNDSIIFKRSQTFRGICTEKVIGKSVCQILKFPNL
jgi:hypothetical protein